MKQKLQYTQDKKNRLMQTANWRLTLPAVDTQLVSEISGLTFDTGMVDDPSPGVLRWNATRIPGTVSYQPITIKRRWNGANKDFYTWVKKVRDGDIATDTYTRDGAIELLDQTMKTVLFTWNFFGAWPSAWKLDTLTKTGDGATMEELTMQVEYIERKKS
jgi:phage tail-like protein